MSTEYNLSTHITPARLISFSDGVFSIAITLLVFNLKVPDIAPNLAHEKLPGAIWANLPHFIAYLISFVLIGIYWNVHHRMFSNIVRINDTFIWLNLIYLLSVSFIPFPSALIGEYPKEAFSLVFYLVSMLMVSTLSVAMWAYATYKDRLTEKSLPPKIKSYFLRRGIYTQAIFLAGIIIAPFSKGIAQFLPFLIFPMQWLLKLWFRRSLQG